MLRSLLAAFVAVLALTQPAFAQFAAFVQPARFELKAKAGEKVAEVLEIGNDDQQTADFRLRTADWTLRPDGGVDFRTDTLAPDSCRPWVKLERYTLRVAAKGKRRYRFEVDVPADARDGLCRFAVIIEPAADAAVVAPLGDIKMPIQGRLGVIVYVRVGEAKPRITFVRFEVADAGGRLTPIAYFRNEGNAHGRPEGFISGTDAAGKAFDFTVAPLPILPGETRGLPIWPQDDADGKPAKPVLPLRLKGVIEWEGGRESVDAVLAK
ncbi:MAG: hypothetical protein IPP91_15030 [Betaproteobacteria bacterium]|nr:hypothetical protein [Betaproteobacteria bacterium]